MSFSVPISKMQKVITLTIANDCGELVAFRRWCKFEALYYSNERNAVEGFQQRRRVAGLVQFVKHLPSLHRALSSKPSTTYTKCGGASLFSALRRVRHEDQKFKVLFNHMVNLQPAWATWQSNVALETVTFCWEEPINKTTEVKFLPLCWAFYPTREQFSNVKAL